MTDSGAERLANAVMAAAGLDYWRKCIDAARLYKDRERIRTVARLYDRRYENLYGNAERAMRDYIDAKNTLYSLERFFRSERALMFYDGDPKYIMETIQRETGISSDRM